MGNIVFFMILFPSITLAKESGIEVKGIPTESKSTNAEIIEKPTIKGLNVGYKIKIINNSSKGILKIKDSKINLISLTSSYNVYGIFKEESVDVDKMNITLNNDRGTKFGIYQSSGTSNLNDINIETSGYNTNYGIYTKLGDVTLKNGSINVYNTKTAYGMYIENANVAITDLSIKAIGTATGIGVKKANGYFNFYDGIITGSTSAKPEVTSSVEYKYQVETYKDADNNEYCILEYMKE